MVPSRESGMKYTNVVTLTCVCGGSLRPLGPFKRALNFAAHRPTWLPMRNIYGNKNEKDVTETNRRRDIIKYSRSRSHTIWEIFFDRNTSVETAVKTTLAQSFFKTFYMPLSVKVFCPHSFSKSFSLLEFLWSCYSTKIRFWRGGTSPTRQMCIERPSRSCEFY